MTKYIILVRGPYKQRRRKFERLWNLINRIRFTGVA